jgi:predicted dehydrogenase
MGRRHARVMAALPERFELVGVVDRDPSRAEAMGSAWSVPAFGDAAEAIASSDLVVVATPIATHARLATSVLEGGRHVFVEKPICANASEADALVLLASRMGRHLFVGHSERFNPVVRAMVRLVRGDEVVALEFHRIGASAREGDSGVLVILGVHDLDLAAYIAHAPGEVRDALGRTLETGGAGEDLAHVLVAMAGGAAGHVYVDRTSRDKHRTMRVTTVRWVYEGDLLAHRLFRTPRASRADQPENDASRVEVPLVTEEPLTAQALAMADALDGAGVREIAIGVDGARALALAERAAERIAARDEAGSVSA